jgi:hypothetical protein
VLLGVSGAAAPPLRSDSPEIRGIPPRRCGLPRSPIRSSLGETPRQPLYTNDRSVWPLRRRYEWPRRRAPETCDELASSHPSSSQAGSVSRSGLPVCPASCSARGGFWPDSDPRQCPRSGRYRVKSGHSRAIESQRIGCLPTIEPTQYTAPGGKGSVERPCARNRSASVSGRPSSMVADLRTRSRPAAAASALALRACPRC